MSEEESINWAASLIIVAIAFLAFLILYEIMTGGKFFRAIVCGMLFWLPLGGVTTALAGGCAAIPV